MRTLLTGGVVVTCDEQHTIHAPGDLVLEDDRIAWVGPSYPGEYDTRMYAGGRLLMPGLINAHTHAPMALLRGLSDDVTLQVFLDQVWPYESRLTPDDVYAGALLAGVEMLKSGVTTYVDMYFFEEANAQAVLEVGARAVITPGILDVPVWTDVLGPLDRQVERVLAFCRTWEGRAGRIHTGPGPHAPYTVPLEALAEIAAEARNIGAPVNIHLVETRAERDAFNARGLGSTISALQEIGFFDGPVIVAHSVWPDDGDLDIYAWRGVGVAHCPQSNAKLAAGVAPVAAMLAAGVQVGLGTDSAVTNNNLDLWEDLRMAPLLAKVQAMDATVLTAGEALWMATRMGARAIHQPELGMLKPGYRADVIMLDLNDTTAVPVLQPDMYIGHLVYAMGREAVDSVWVNGSLVVKGRQVLTVDEERVRREAQAVALDLVRRVNG